jgi:hypothetical protein
MCTDNQSCSTKETWVLMSLSVSCNVWGFLLSKFLYFLLCCYDAVLNKTGLERYIFGVQWNSSGGLHATSCVVMLASCFVDIHHWKEMWAYITYSAEIRYGTIISRARMVQGHYYDHMICSWENCDLGFHCCNSVFQQWPQSQLLQQCIPIILGPIVVTVFQYLTFYCCNSVPGMALGHVGFPDRQILTGW